MRSLNRSRHPNPGRDARLGGIADVDEGECASVDHVLILESKSRWDAEKLCHDHSAADALQVHHLTRQCEATHEPRQTVRTELHDAHSMRTGDDQQVFLDREDELIARFHRGTASPATLRPIREPTRSRALCGRSLSPFDRVAVCEDRRVLTSLRRATTHRNAHADHPPHPAKRHRTTSLS